MKRPMAIIALSLHVAYYLLLILSLTSEDYDAGFGAWVWAVFLAFPIFGLHLADGIVLLVKKSGFFSVLRLVLICLLFPCLITFGGGVDHISILIWNVYFFAVSAIQMVSLFTSRE